MSSKSRIRIPSLNMRNSDSVLLIRITVSFVLIMLAMLLKLNPIIKTLMYLISALIAGYNFLPEAISAIGKGRYLARPVLILASASLTFIIGFYAEGAFTLVIYQICKLGVEYSESFIKSYALGLIDESDTDYEFESRFIETDENCGLTVSDTIRISARPILFAIIGIALLIAILFPIMLNYAPKIAIHRAIIILLLACPDSMLRFIPSLGRNAVSYAKAMGTEFSSVAALEALKKINSVIVTKSCIYKKKTQYLIDMHSEATDIDTFAKFLVHMVCNSKQDFAKTILRDLNLNYDSELVKEFEDISGSAVIGKINGLDVSLGTKEYYIKRGVMVPVGITSGTYYYLYLAEKYVGSVELSSNAQSDCSYIVNSFKEQGVNYCAIISDSDEFIHEFDETYIKREDQYILDAVNDIAANLKGKKIFLSDLSYSKHSNATLDITTGIGSDISDAVIKPGKITDFPFMFSISKKIESIAVENSLILFGAKALMIFLSIIGYCNLWFAILIEAIIAIITVLNTTRVSSN